MLRNSKIGALAVLAVLFVSSGQTTEAQAKLTAAEIADKNAAARGGLQAWRSVQTLSMSGKMGAGGNRRDALPMAMPDKGKGKVNVPQRPAEEVQLPFLMEMKRPHKMRFELEFKGDTAVQIFDGQNGWKLRPYLGRREIEAYSADELKSASSESELDGPLIDYAAKGSQLELLGTEKVEGRDCYKLKLTQKNGAAKNVWVDANSFLEAKIEGQPRRLDGVYHPVEVYYRDYRAVNGLQIPFVLETKVLPVAAKPAATGKPTPAPTPIPSEKTVIDKVTINPKLDDALFAKASLEAKAPPATAPAKK